MKRSEIKRSLRKPRVKNTHICLATLLKPAIYHNTAPACITSLFYRFYHSLSKSETILGQTHLFLLHKVHEGGSLYFHRLTLSVV